jgi:hypothetical protein
MGKTSIALAGLLFLAVNGVAQAIPSPATTSQATNLVVQDVYMSPARVGDFWYDVVIPFVLSNSGSGIPNTNGSGTNITVYGILTSTNIDAKIKSATNGVLVTASNIFSVKGSAGGVVPAPATTSQATNLVTQDAYMSPARVGDFWYDVVIPYIAANGGGGSGTATNLSGNALVQVTNISQSVGGGGGGTTLSNGLPTIDLSFVSSPAFIQNTNPYAVNCVWGGNGIVVTNVVYNGGTTLVTMDGFIFGGATTNATNNLTVYFSGTPLHVQMYPVGMLGLSGTNGLQGIQGIAGNNGTNGLNAPTDLNWNNITNQPVIPSTNGFVDASITNAFVINNSGVATNLTVFGSETITNASLTITNGSLTITGTNGVATNAPNALTLKGGTGSIGSSGHGNGYLGGGISITLGTGGDAYGSSPFGNGGKGGGYIVQAGTGGSGTDGLNGGAGGDYVVYGATGGSGNAGGKGGGITNIAGNGANGTGASGGNGGDIGILAGTGGSATGSGATGGTIAIQSGTGGVSSGGGTGSGGTMTLSSGTGGGSPVSASPGGTFTLNGGTGGNTAGVNATAGKGGSASFNGGAGGISTNGTGGAGGDFSLTGGTGAAASTSGKTSGAGGSLTIAGGLAGASTSGAAADGGSATIAAGDGGATVIAGYASGKGGSLTIRSGVGGISDQANGGTDTAGAAGNLVIYGANGGLHHDGAGGNGYGGAGGSVYIYGGTGGAGLAGAGVNGNAFLAVKTNNVVSGSVGVGTTNLTSGYVLDIQGSVMIRTNLVVTNNITAYGTNTATYFVGNGGGLTNLTSVIQQGSTNAVALTAFTATFAQPFVDTNYTAVAIGNGFALASSYVSAKTINSCVFNMTIATGAIDWVAVHQ